jgi:high-affinity iron transporter
MGQAFLMVLREGFESFLIVAIILSYLQQTGKRGLVSAVYLAVGISLVISVGLGWVLMRGVNQSLWEGVLGIVTILLVGSLVVHMWKAAPHLKTQIHRQLWKVSKEKTGLWAYAGIFFFTLVMISREGMETALMLLQVRDSGVIGGIVLGLLAAVVVSWAWVNYSHLINLKRFFQVTSAFLVIFMVQIAVYSFHEFTEAGVLPNSEALHIATESFSPMGRYGQWFSMVSVGGCALWLMMAQIKDYRKRTLALR